MQLRRAQPSEVGELRAWIRERHYLKSLPPGHVCVLEFLEAGKRIGAMLISRPAARAYDADKVLELARMYFVDSTTRCTESKALAMMRRYVRVWLPGVKLLLTYSDERAGHLGTVYAADNWAPFGRTKATHGYGWKSREGRRDDHCWSKQRWVRTP